MDSLPRRVLTLIAVVAVVTGASACGGDDEAASGGSDTATKGEATTAESPSPAAQEQALEDTSVRPVIPKPTGAPPRRLVKEDIVKGKGRAAKRGDTVVLNYVAMNFSNGKEFDASWDRGQPIPVQLGVAPVIEGWQKGLVGIRKGGRRKLTVPPELGYGAQGYPPDIPPNETLIYVIDAVSVN